MRCSAARRAAPGSPDGGRALCRAQLVVVFMVGGTTYEEARAVADLNAQVPHPDAVLLCAASAVVAPRQYRRPARLQGERGEGWPAGTRFLLGGTGVLNSQALLRDMLEVGAAERMSGA